MTRRMSRPSPIGVMSRTVPSAVTIPVNIQAALREFGQHVVAERRIGDAAQKRGIASRRSTPNACDRGPAIAAHHRGRVEPGDPVDQVGTQQRRGESTRRPRPAPA